MKFSDAREEEIWVRMAVARASIVFQNTHSSYKSTEVAEFADRMVLIYRSRLGYSRIAP